MTVKKPPTVLVCVMERGESDYNAYKAADFVAYLAAQGCIAAEGYVPVSVETTHGIVNMAMSEAITKLGMTNKPCIEFVSPITDRFGNFDEDVGTSGLQNYIAGYNAGIAVGHFLKSINDGC